MGTSSRRAGRLIVSPSPYGTCTDLARIAEICHERGKPLIVDEAWGAHLPFHEHLPTWAMDAGADVCVVSVHKMGAGFEQGSVFHVQGDLIDRHRLSACADLLMTTSPNVMVYAALDGWRRQMVEHGRQLLGDALELGRGVRDDIELIPDVEVLDDELLGVEGLPRPRPIAGTDRRVGDRNVGLPGRRLAARASPSRRRYERSPAGARYHVVRRRQGDR